MEVTTGYLMARSHTDLSVAIIGMERMGRMMKIAEIEIREIGTHMEDLEMHLDLRSIRGCAREARIHKRLRRH